jgi:hypothetical protein
VSCLELIYVQGREEKPAAQPAKTEYRILKKKIMITFDQKKKKRIFIIITKGKNNK